MRKTKRGAAVGDPAKRAELLAGLEALPEGADDGIDVPTELAEPAAGSARPLADVLDVIALRAEGLRRAGVLRVSFGDTSFELAPRIEPPPAPPKETAEEHPDPLRDSATFANGRVAGLQPYKERFSYEE